MRWRAVPKQAQDPAEWHLVFLWKPIRHEDFKYWLCFMQRRQRLKIVDYQTFDPMWEYQEPYFYA